MHTYIHVCIKQTQTACFLETWLPTASPGSRAAFWYTINQFNRIKKSYWVVFILIYIFVSRRSHSRPALKLATWLNLRRMSSGHLLLWGNSTLMRVLLVPDLGMDLFPANKPNRPWMDLYRSWIQAIKNADEPSQKITPLSISATRENLPSEMEAPTLVITESTRHLLAIYWHRIDKITVPLTKVNDTLLLWRHRYLLSG